MDGCDNFSEINNTLGIGENIADAFGCAGINVLQILSCITSQNHSLIILLIILYAWSNQYTQNYLMSINKELICTLSCLLDKLVDSAIDNCKNCANCVAASPAATNKKRKHKRHRHKECDCDCDCDCDFDCDCEEY